MSLYQEEKKRIENLNDIEELKETLEYWIDIQNTCEDSDDAYEHINHCMDKLNKLGIEDINL